MLDERLRFVLHQKVDGTDPGVDQIAEGEIDDSVASTERHGRLAALGGERSKTLAFTAGHNKGYDSVYILLFYHGASKRWMPSRRASANL
jgi:hypothetical protein